MVAAQFVYGRDGAKSFSGQLAHHIPALRRFARRLTRNEESAADLTQETQAKAWAARNSYAPGTNLKAWLLAIMRNQFRSEMRRAWRQAPWDQEAAERIPSGVDQQTWSIELADAARAISSLSRRQREALILSGLGGFSGDDVGAIVRCGRAAAKSRVSRARHAVASMLDGTEPLKTGRNRASHDLLNDLLGELRRLAPSTIG